MPTFTAQANSTGQTDAARRLIVLRVTFATPADDYVLGGYDIDAELPARVGPGATIRKFSGFAFTTATGAIVGRTLFRQPTNARIIAFDMPDGLETDAGTNLSAETWQLEFEVD